MKDKTQTQTETLAALREEALAEYNEALANGLNPKTGKTPRKPRETKAQRQARLGEEARKNVEAEKTEFTLAEAQEEELKLLEAEGEQPKAQADDEAKSNLARTISKYRNRYEDAVKTHGNGPTSKTKICGDPLSKILIDREPHEVVLLAEAALKLAPGELATRYAKLNPGQQRMNSGNRLRAAIKRGDLTLDALLIVLHDAPWEATQDAHEEPLSQDAKDAA